MRLRTYYVSGVERFAKRNIRGKSSQPLEMPALVSREGERSALVSVSQGETFAGFFSDTYLAFGTMSISD
jgi:hypothetical protein